MLLRMRLRGGSKRSTMWKTPYRYPIKCYTPMDSALACVFTSFCPLPCILRQRQQTSSLFYQITLQTSLTCHTHPLTAPCGTIKTALNRQCDSETICLVRITRKANTKINVRLTGPQKVF